MDTGGFRCSYPVAGSGKLAVTITYLALVLDRGLECGGCVHAWRDQRRCCGCPVFVYVYMLVDLVDFVVSTNCLCCCVCLGFRLCRIQVPAPAPAPARGRDRGRGRGGW